MPVLPCISPLGCDIQRQICFCRAQSLARKLQNSLEEYVPFPTRTTQNSRNDSEDGCFVLGSAFELERGRRSGPPSPEILSVDHSEEELEDSGRNKTEFVHFSIIGVLFPYANHSTEVVTKDRKRNRSVS